MHFFYCSGLYLEKTSNNVYLFFVVDQIIRLRKIKMMKKNITRYGNSSLYSSDQTRKQISHDQFVHIMFLTAD